MNPAVLRQWSQGSKNSFSKLTYPSKKQSLIGLWTWNLLLIIVYIEKMSVIYPRPVTWKKYMGPMPKQLVFGHGLVNFSNPEIIHNIKINVVWHHKSLYYICIFIYLSIFINIYIYYILLNNFNNWSPGDDNKVHSLFIYFNPTSLFVCCKLGWSFDPVNSSSYIWFTQWRNWKSVKKTSHQFISNSRTWSLG